MILFVLLGALLTPQTCQEYETLTAPLYETILVIDGELLSAESRLMEAEWVEQAYTELVTVRQKLELIIPPPACIKVHMARLYLVGNYLDIIVQGKEYHLTGDAEGLLEALKHFNETVGEWQ